MKITATIAAFLMLFAPSLDAGETTVSGLQPYNPDNVFAKILRDELPADLVYQDQYVMAFKDITPLAPVHTLIIPKQPYRSILDLSTHATDEEILGLVRSISLVAKQEGVHETGFSLITNFGHEGGQTVPHLHFNLLGGDKIEWEKHLKKQRSTSLTR